MTPKEPHPLFSKKLRERITNYLKVVHEREQMPDNITMQAGINLILEALLEA